MNVVLSNYLIKTYYKKIIFIAHTPE